MPISYSEMRTARIAPSVLVAKSMEDANRLRLKTAFLSHSHLDRPLVEGLVSILNTSGWNVYVDWMDATMPDRPNPITAKNIKDRINDCHYFLFLATNNSMRSRWCPWEIGYADGIKYNDRILIVPTIDDSGINYGNEYLGLYRRIDRSILGDMASLRPGEEYGTNLRDFSV